MFKEPYIDDRPQVYGLSPKETAALVEAIDINLLEQKTLYEIHCKLYGQTPNPHLSEYDYFNTPALRSLIELTAKAKVIGPAEFIREAERKFHREKTENPDATADLEWSMVALGLAFGKAL